MDYPYQKYWKNLLQIFHQNNLKTMKYIFLQVFITIENTQAPTNSNFALLVISFATLKFQLVLN